MFERKRLNLPEFLREVRFGYLLFTSLLILGFFFGAFELIKLVFFEDVSERTLQVLYVTRGVTVSFSLILWSAWTVYSYRQIYNKKLDLTEQQYQNIVENSADAIITLDKNNRISSWNQGAENIFGWSSEEIGGESVETIIPQKLIDQRELECLEYGMYYKGFVNNYQTERVCKNGKIILVNLTESFIKDTDGKVIGRSQILRDLTNLKLREEQIQHSERLATLGHMAAGVAHEVGNPLTAISSLVQVAERKSKDPFVREQLGKVREHIQRITKIVRDLVDFSRPSSLKAESMQLNNVIKSAVGLLKHDARCRTVAFHLNLAPELPVVHGVPDHIHQVLVNLLLNSVDAMQHLKEPVINIETWADHEKANISIEDIGKGIPADVQNRVFEPFFTTKETGNGTGLGLSVSHGIITKMKGTIDMESEENVGTKFTISLPVEKKEELV